MPASLINSSLFKKIILGLFLIGSLSTWLGLKWYNTHYISTDDAYVNAPTVPIAARIPGKIIAIYVKNNQYVEQGALLFALDDKPYQIAVAAAKAQVAINEAQVIEANIKAQRTLALVKTRYASPQAGDTSTALLKTAQGNLSLAKVKLEQALLNLHYTQIKAPTSGYITNHTLQVGTLINANQPVFALVSNQTWIDANFKETEIKAIKPGQVATIVSDIYPQHPLPGVVDSMSSGTGAAFSLLPPQNASGNWVKVTQRIPIKIRLSKVDKYKLPIGSSAAVTIHLQQFAN